MQTFMPYPDFTQTAKVLDYRRLGKQRVECFQILRALTDPEYGWKNHPAVKMWKGHERSLVSYGLAIVEEWTSRGYKDSVKTRLLSLLPALPGEDSPPVWVGNDKVHQSHRSNLLRKFPSYYRKVWPTDPDDLPYVWPV